MTIKDDSKLRFYLLNFGKLATEDFVSIPELKIKYPDLLKKSYGILETFVNLCLDQWAKDYNGKWNVGLFDVII